MYQPCSVETVQGRFCQRHGKRGVFALEPSKRALARVAIAIEKEQRRDFRLQLRSSDEVLRQDSENVEAALIAVLRSIVTQVGGPQN